MKKLMTALIAITLILTVAFGAWAAGATVTPTYVPVPHSSVWVLTFTWLADDGNGTVPTTIWGDGVTEQPIYGYVVRATTNPGTTAPQDNYDITLTDADGIDVMGGALMNRDTVTSEHVGSLLQAGNFDWCFVDGTLTLNLSGNNVNSATGVLKVYIQR